MFFEINIGGIGRLQNWKICWLLENPVAWLVCHGFEMLDQKKSVALKRSFHVSKVVFLASYGLDLSWCSSQDDRHKMNWCLAVRFTSVCWLSTRNAQYRLILVPWGSVIFLSRLLQGIRKHHSGNITASEFPMTTHSVQGLSTPTSHWQSYHEQVYNNLTIPRCSMVLEYLLTKLGHENAVNVAKCSIHGAYMFWYIIP